MISGLLAQNNVRTWRSFPSEIGWSASLTANLVRRALTRPSQSLYAAVRWGAASQQSKPSIYNECRASYATLNLYREERSTRPWGYTAGTLRAGRGISLYDANGTWPKSLIGN